MIVLVATVVSPARSTANVRHFQDFRERAARLVDAELADRDAIYRELARDASDDARAALVAALEARYERKFQELAALPSYRELVVLVQQRTGLEAAREQLCASLLLLKSEQDAGLSTVKREEECAVRLRKLLTVWSGRARVALNSRFKSILREFRWIDERCAELTGRTEVRHGEAMPAWLPFVQTHGSEFLSVTSIELDVRGWERKLWNDRVIPANTERFAANPGPEPSFPSIREQRVAHLIGEFCQVVGLPAPEWSLPLFDAPLEVAKHDTAILAASLRAAANGDTSISAAIAASARKAGWDGEKCAIQGLVLASGEAQLKDSLGWSLSNADTAVVMIAGGVRRFAVRSCGTEVWLVLGIDG